MISDLEQLFLVTASAVGEFRLDGKQFIGIPIALAGAVLLALGAQYQSRGLNKVEQITERSVSSGISWRQWRGLLTRPSWVIGSVLLTFAVGFQLVSLSLSPLIVVQPLGVVALVITAVVNARLSRHRLASRAVWAIICCVLGISVFVTVAAFNAMNNPVTDQKLLTILVLFTCIFVLALALFLAFRRRAVALIYIVGAGVLYGFVATFAKAVIGRLQQGEFEWLTWLCVLALICGALLGLLFVQHAYSSGPPDLVVAGLTVIDPLVAVLIGVAVLGEATRASGPVIALFVVSAVLAIVGVYRLAKHHPQTGMNVVLAGNTGSVPIAQEDESS